MSEILAAVITAFNEPPNLTRVPFCPLEDGDVIVKVDAATLCGTDVGRWKGVLSQGGDDQPFVRPFGPPYVPGHETCGTIVEMRGAPVDILNQPLAEGDRIVSSYGHCGRCYYCQVTRQTSFCKEVGTFGHSPPEDMTGGCATHHRYSANGTFIRVPENVSPALAASGTCALRTIMHGFEQVGRIDSHETVLVLGSGPLGLYALAVARERGARKVLMIGAPASRLGVARNWGADDVLNIENMADVAERINWARAMTEGRGADIVFNCAASPALVEAMRMARPGGKLVQVATSGGADIALPPLLLFRGVRMLLPIMAEARHFFQAMEFLRRARDRFPLEEMISGAYDLAGTGLALKRMADLQEVKPVIYPNGPPAT